MKRLVRSISGFTILEVIVAILIISTLAIAFAPLIVSSLERIRWSGQRMEELYAWRSKMEAALASKGAVHANLIIKQQNDFPLEEAESKNYMADWTIDILEVGSLVSVIPRQKTDRGE